MYEHRSEPLAALPVFIRRIVVCLLLALAVLAVALLMGMSGYHWIAGLGWVDAFLNASMILTGMGPVDALPTAGSKIFAGLYAIFSGLVFLSIMGIVLAPVLHRLMHAMHLSDEDVNS